jgi:hypothetical protein
MDRRALLLRHNGLFTRRQFLVGGVGGGPVCAGEGGGGLQRGVGLVEHHGERLEDVRYLGPDLQFDVDVVFGGAGCQPYGVVQQDLVRADLDEQGREPRQVGEDRAGQGRGGVGLAQVVAGADLQPLGGQRGIDVGLSP